MKTNLERAKQAISARWQYGTAKSRLNDEAFLMYEKMTERGANKANEQESIKTFSDKLIISKLDKIAKAMPNEGYSMGGRYVVKFQKLEGIFNNCDTYAKSCKFRPTYGGYTTKITLDELKNIKVIGGVVTYIYPNQKGKCKRCWWYDSKGSKQHFQLVKVNGFLYGDYHNESKTIAISVGKRLDEQIRERQKKFDDNKKRLNKAMRLQYTFQDSLDAGNCEVGTKAFILRCKLDSTKKYRGAYLLKVATEKSTNSVSFVKRMLEFKTSK